MKRNQEEISALFAGTFRTELGKRTLEHLKNVFVDRDIYVKGLSFEEVAFRQGEASVVNKIIKELERQIND